MEQRTVSSEQRTCSKFVGALMVALLGVAASAQQIQLGGLGESSNAGKKQHVVLLSDAVEAQVGASQPVELRFRVDAGFHINSHNPKDELLIPTTLKLDDAAALKVSDAKYPAGTSFTIGSGKDAQVLDVYKDEFRVGLRMSVPRGTTTLTGTLRYQACDNVACFPPRSLPVKVLLTAK